MALLGLALEHTAPALGAAARHMLHDGLGVFAFGVARTGQEFAEAAQTDDHPAPAELADLVRDLLGDLDAGVLQRLLGSLHLGVEAGIEIAEDLLIAALAGLDVVELVFHPGSELHVDHVVEAVEHELGHDLAQRRRLQMLFALDHVFAILDRGDDGRVGGRTAHALFLHRLDQRGLGIAGGRLGEVLVAMAGDVQDLLALAQLGQGVQLLLALVVPALLIDGQEAGEAEVLVGGAEDVTGAFAVDRGGIVDRVGHLAGHEAAPDQAVQAVLVAAEILLQGLGVQTDVAGPDGLVRVLGSGLRPVMAGLGGAEGLAVALRDQAARGGDGLLRETEGVGTHIGDQTHGAVSGHVHALIELLGDGHGAARGHVELAGGLLLEGGGDEGGRGRAVLFGLLDGLHGEALTLHVALDGLDLGLGLQRALFAVAVVVGLEGSGLVDAAQGHVQGPVFLRHEGADLLLPLHDHPRCDGLDAARRQAAADLPPEQGRELVADDAVQNPARLLGVHEVAVDLARVGDGLGDDAAGDLVEGHAAGLVVRELEQLLDVPGDRLALAVRVGCEIDGLRPVGGLLELLDEVGFLLHRDIFRTEIMVQIHAHRALRQIAQMTHAGLDDIVRAEVFSDGFRLGWGLHNHKIGILVRHESCSSVAVSIEFSSGHRIYRGRGGRRREAPAG